LPIEKRRFHFVRKQHAIVINCSNFETLNKKSKFRIQKVQLSAVDTRFYNHCAYHSQPCKTKLFISGSRIFIQRVK